MYTSKQRTWYAGIAIKHKQRAEINHGLKFPPPVGVNKFY